jgi:hypothetical protein
MIKFIYCIYYMIIIIYNDSYTLKYKIHINERLIQEQSYKTGLERNIIIQNMISKKRNDLKNQIL